MKIWIVGKNKIDAEKYARSEVAMIPDCEVRTFGPNKIIRSFSFVAKGLVPTIVEIKHLEMATSVFESANIDDVWFTPEASIEWDKYLTIQRALMK